MKTPGKNQNLSHYEPRTGKKLLTMVVLDDW